jgi:hypothetical protein
VFFSFFESPFWRGAIWLAGFLLLKAVFGFETTVVVGIAVLAMQNSGPVKFLF